MNDLKRNATYNSIKKNKILGIENKLNQGVKKTCTLKTTKQC